MFYPCIWIEVSPLPVHKWRTIINTLPNRRAHQLFHHFGFVVSEYIRDILSIENWFADYFSQKFQIFTDFFSQTLSFKDYMNGICIYEWGSLSELHFEVAGTIIQLWWELFVWDSVKSNTLVNTIWPKMQIF